MGSDFFRKRALKKTQPRNPTPSGTQTLRGSVVRFSFENKENGYAVARFEPFESAGGAEKGRECVITGTLAHIEAGESLKVTGQWTQNPRFGVQFAVESFERVPPSSREGIQAFLGSGMIAGIGKEYARRIAEAFGENTLEVIDETPERLHEVEGIGPKRYQKIIAGWQEHRDMAEIMSFLQSFNISPSWAVRIYRYYGNEAVHILKRNPYRLAIDIRGIGFKQADKIAQSGGMAADADERIEAAVYHVLQEAAGKGHTFYPFDTLSEKTLELVELEDAQRVRTATSELCKTLDDGPRAVAEKLPEGDKAVYLYRLWQAENAAAEYVDAILTHGHNLPAIDGPKEAADFESTTGFSLASRQREAVELALRGGITILTGGPGTGKTTTLRAVIHGLNKHRVHYHLAAPTGRAAKRLAESTRREAATIHRLLKFDPEKGGFTYNSNMPLPTDYLIIDEASMLDISLFHHVLRALPPSASLLLVGDIDQLPSVGPGNVLRDLIDSGRVPVVRLDTIFRQARQSLIVRNAHRINAGEFPSLRGDEEEEGRRKSDFFFVERDDPEEALDTIVDLVARRIPARYQFDAINDIQVLTPMHRGVLGAQNLNEKLQSTLNNDPRTLQRGHLKLKIGDKVMQRENDYDKDVYNGDIGIIHGFDSEDHIARIRYGRRVVPYSFLELDALSLSYAVTVHKSQGSEYPCVVVPVHTQHFIMLQRNLLYTAITRGKKLVVCVGTKKAIALAVQNDKISERCSGLQQRIQYKAAN